MAMRKSLPIRWTLPVIGAEHFQCMIVWLGNRAALLAGCLLLAGCAAPGSMQWVAPLDDVLSASPSAEASSARHDLHLRAAQYIPPSGEAASEVLDAQPPAGRFPPEATLLEEAEVIQLSPAAPETIVGELPAAELLEPESLDIGVLEIDLSQALAMAGGQNPNIAIALARYREAYAQHDAARRCGCLRCGRG